MRPLPRRLFPDGAHGNTYRVDVVIDERPPLGLAQ